MSKTIEWQKKYKGKGATKLRTTKHGWIYAYCGDDKLCRLEPWENDNTLDFLERRYEDEISLDEIIIFYNRECNNNENAMLVSLSQPPVKNIKENDDEMEVILECPYCHKHHKYGEMSMVSGYVGCSSCIDDLSHTVLTLREHDYETYRSGKWYDQGYKIERIKR